VEGVSFEIGPGETLGLVGESGSGKSVTALSVPQLLPYPHARHPSGSIRFEGAELVGAPEHRLQRIRGNRIGMIFQEPMSSLNPVMTVGEQIEEVLQAHQGLDRPAARERALVLLRRVRLPEPERRLRSYPFELSGGQAQRAMIAVALANDPRLLIADEPTTALDVTVQAQILGLLRELREDLGLALMLITHDLAIVRKMADRVCVMQGGRIVETGSTAALFADPRHPYTRMLLAAEPRGAPVPVPAEAPVVLQAEGLGMRFPIRSGLLRRVTGHVQAVRGVSLSVREGQTVGVVGESGSGKTTLGRLLLRLVDGEGRIRFDGADITGRPRRALRPMRRAFQIVFQDPVSALSPRMRVEEIVGEGLRIHGIGAPGPDRTARIEAALAEVGIDPATRRRFPHEFSGGQRQRIAIARVLVLKPRLIVLDEPTSALDRSVQAQIVELLRDLQARHGIAYVFISHDLAVVRALADAVIVMKDGTVVESGPAAGLFARPRHPYTRSLFRAAFELEPEPADDPPQGGALPGAAPGPELAAPPQPAPTGTEGG
jgi:microcin C transport system ATP-binding protein